MNIFRREYRPLSVDEQMTVEDIKVCADELYELIQELHDTREKSLAITKLEEAVMWAVKGITG